MEKLSEKELRKLNKFIASRDLLAQKIRAIRQKARIDANAQIVKFVRPQLREAEKIPAGFFEGLKEILEAEKKILESTKPEAVSRKPKSLGRKDIKNTGKTGDLSCRE